MRVREWQDKLYHLAHRVEDNMILSEGLYELRHFLPEGGNLHAWISVYNMALARPLPRFHRLRLQVAQAWHLMLVGALSAADDILRMAEVAMRELPTYCRRPAHVPTQLLVLDATTYRLILRSLRSVGNNDIKEALLNSHEADQLGRPAQRARAELALAAVKFSMGMIESAEANLDFAYRYFERRNMNTECGFAAFGLGRYYCERDGIDPLDYPPTDRGLMWLVRAALHFSMIGLPLGLELIAPYLRHVDFELPKFKKPELIPPFKTPLLERFSAN